MEENSLEFVSLALRAKYPALYLVSHEETRVMGELAALASAQDQRLLRWSISSGLIERDNSPGAKRPYKDVEPGMTGPGEVLDWIGDDKKAQEKVILVLCDFHEFLDGDIVVRRKFREVAEQLRSRTRAMIILSPVCSVHKSLEKLVTLVDIRLPDRGELTERLGKLKARLLEQKGAPKFLLDQKDFESVVNAGLGLTRHEFDQSIGRVLVQNKVIDSRAIAVVAGEKKQIVRRSGLMEFYETDQKMSDVGGLDLLKSWLSKRIKAFGDEAREFGLKDPKGLLLVGIQGCGKSTVAKAASALLRIPLLRLDVGALFGGLVGESESNARKAIQVAETLSPCILWLDEIEKGMSGLQSSGGSDGGTTARVFSTFLTWMAEKTKPVFVIATANDVSSLPPELLRKGRFDEIFAIDLPVEAERASILGIHVTRAKRDPAKFDLVSVAKETDGFSGAELEALVSEGMFEAFDAGRDLETTDLLHAAKLSVPLSRTMSEKINALRRWAKHRARPASSLQETAAPVDSPKEKKGEDDVASDLFGD
jgi:SpoVK/Ycf46/Vps4 family AAA+-type ATPase